LPARLPLAECSPAGRVAQDPTGADNDGHIAPTRTRRLGAHAPRRYRHGRSHPTASRQRRLGATRADQDGNAHRGVRSWARSVAMTITCGESQYLAAEFALGILDAPSRTSVAQHLLNCPECRSEVTSLKAAHRRLLELVPGTEPPLGFDRRVLSNLEGRRGRHRGAALSLAAGLTFVAVSAGWAVAATRHDEHTVPSAVPHHPVLTVRDINGYGSGPRWLEVTVHSANSDMRVTCQLLESTGQVIDLGSFDLVNGDGEWSAPDNAGLANALAVRVTDARGDVIASTPPPR
jgi:hypothetical protein